MSNNEFLDDSGTTDGGYGDDPSASQPPVPLRRRMVAVFLALGGLWGMVKTISLLLAADVGRGASHGQVGLSLVLFVFCTVDGVLLWTRKRIGLFLGIAALVPQVIAVRVGNFEYSFNTALAVLLGVSSSGPSEGGIGVLLRAGSHFVLGHSGETAGGFIMVNLIAAGCIVLLLPLLRYSTEQG